VIARLARNPLSADQESYTSRRRRPAAAPHKRPLENRHSYHEPNSGLIVPPGTFTIAHRSEVTLLAACYRLPSFIRIASLLNSAACCLTELTWPIICGARRPMPIVSSRARSRASFPCSPSQVRAGDQPQNGQGARTKRPCDAAVSCRRGGRIDFFAAAQNVCFWHKADIARLSPNVRFWG
jgi:hypothetical protein